MREIRNRFQKISDVNEDNVVIVVSTRIDFSGTERQQEQEKEQERQQDGEVEEVTVGKSVLLWNSDHF